MSNQGHELILIPRLENPKVIGDQLKSDLSTLSKTVNAQGGIKIGITLDKQAIDSTKKQLSEIANLHKQSTFIGISDFSSSNSISKEIATEKAEVAKLTQATKEQKAAEEQRATAAINNAKIDIANSKLKVQLKREEITMAKMEASQAKTQSANEQNVKQVNQQVAILQSRIDRVKVVWSQMFSDPTVIARLTDIESKLSTVGGDASKVRELSGEFQILSNNVTEAGLNTKTFGDRIKETSTKLSAYLVNMLAYQAAISGIKNGIEAVKELDLSLTEIRKVTDLSGNALKEFTDRAFEAADAIGRTGKDLVDATAEFRRAGYSLENSFEMGKAALVMTNVGDGIDSVEEAASALIATLRGFNMSETGVMDVVNAINEVDLLLAS